MEIKRFDKGDTLVMKKHHACAPAAVRLLVLMAGSDIKVKCVHCGHEMIVPRIKLEKNIKKIEPAAKEPSDV